MKKSFLLAYTILGLTIVSFAQVDAAVKVGDSIYFFKGSNCVTYSLITNKPIANQSISTVWPSLSYNSDISSAFMLKNKLIFTKDNTYVEWDIQKKRGDIPQVIIAGNFGFSKLDAAFEFPNSENGGDGVDGKVYFFGGSKYCRSDLFDGVLDQTNKANSNWTGLGWSTIDAALTNNNTVYFFKGDEVARVNIATQTVVSKTKINDIFKLPLSWFIGSTNKKETDNKVITDNKDKQPNNSEITIGTQTWATKNLDVKTYRDGTEIEHVTSNSRWTTTTTGAWCYYDNDPSKGVLYNGYAVNDKVHGGIASAGWHIPTSEEWRTLINEYGGENKAGRKMKESNGFAALLTGYRNSNNGVSYGFNRDGNFWTSTKSATSSKLNFRRISNSDDTIRSYVDKPIAGFSVRLIKDKVSSNTSGITTNNSVVKIGNQTWMAKDLNVTTYRDGTPIRQVQNASAWVGLTDGAWCYYDASNPSKGVLYNWYAVNEKRYGGLAPVDWYIPTKGELTTLTSYGTSLINSQFVPGKGGFRKSADGREFNNGLVSYYWSATDNSTTKPNSAWSLYIENSTGAIKTGDFNRKNGLSVRCIQRVVQIEEAITSWPIALKLQLIDVFVKFYKEKGHTENQSKKLTNCIISGLENKYPNILSFNSLSEADKDIKINNEYESCKVQLGFKYHLLKFLNKNWMAYDLDVTAYRDGTPINHVQNVKAWSGLTDGAFCYVDINDHSKGVLYNWYAVNEKKFGGLAPAGWHIPNRYQWTAVNSSNNNINYTPYFEGGKYYHDGVEVKNNGILSYWWSSELYNSSNAYAERGQKIYTGVIKVNDNPVPINWGLRVRCMQD